MMFQLNFGLTAFESGLMTLATALGAFGMKLAAPYILRRFGFRDSLTINGVAATLGYATCALFRPDWPFAAIFAIMALCGFLMSFQFTAYNTVAYDEIAPERLSAATSFYTTFQQLMLSLGICVGALGLQSSMGLRGDTQPKLQDFSAAFLLVTTVSMGATIWNRRFAPAAGAVISGHSLRKGVPAHPEAAALSVLAEASGD